MQNVACVPIPDANLGEKMCACVILRHGAALSLEIIATALFLIVISALATDNAPWSGILAPIAIGGRTSRAC